MLVRADALSTFIWVVMSSLAVLTLSSPVSGAILNGSLLLLLVLSRSVPVGKIFRSVPIILLVPVCLLGFHSVFDPGRGIFRIGVFRITAEGLRLGLILFFRVSFVVLASLTFLWLKDIREFMVGLVRIGVPYRLAFTIYLTLRYIPLMRVERESILDAIVARRQSQRISLRWRLALWARYIFLLVVNGLRKADQTAIAIQMRGFGVKHDRTFITPFHFTFHGPMLIIATALTFCFLLWRFG